MESRVWGLKRENLRPLKNTVGGPQNEKEGGAKEGMVRGKLGLYMAAVVCVEAMRFLSSLLVTVGGAGMIQDDPSTANGDQKEWRRMSFKRDGRQPCCVRFWGARGSLHAKGEVDTRFSSPCNLIAEGREGATVGPRRSRGQV